MKNKNKRNYVTRKIRMKRRLIKYSFIVIGVLTVSNYLFLGCKSYYETIFNFFYTPATASINFEVINKKPEIKVYEIVKEYEAVVTAYNAGDPNQCDSTPCIAANGENVCTAVALGHKRCASNNLPFGTRLYVEGYGECLVTDRMNSRYQNGEIDVAMPADQKEEAIKFGAHKRLVKILK